MIFVVGSGGLIYNYYPPDFMPQKLPQNHPGGYKCYAGVGIPTTYCSCYLSDIIEGMKTGMHPQIGLEAREQVVEVRGMR